jgi:hypothetical protein
MPGITDLQTNQSTQSLVDYLNSDPSQVAFGLENQIDQLFQDYIIAKNSGDTPTAQMLEEQINSLQAEVIRLKNMRGDTSYARDMMNNLKSNLNESGRTISNAERMGMAGGGEAFPDLTGDGKVTKADILKGRGVFAEGDEVQMGMMEMEMEPEGDDIQESLMAIQGANQEAAPLDQFVQAVIQMIQAGASEQEVIEMLRQAGLDEEDINAVFQAVMQSLQGPGIDQELAALG